MGVFSRWAVGSLVILLSPVLCPGPLSWGQDPGQSPPGSGKSRRRVADGQSDLDGAR